MRYVKICTKVERRIETLRQSGKAGKVIARKALSDEVHDIVYSKMVHDIVYL